MHSITLKAAAFLAFSSHALAATCVMPHTSGGDDSPGIIAAAKACVNDSTILFSEGVNYNLLTPLSFTGLQNVKFSFEGNISLSTNITEVQSVVNNTKVYPGHWITVKGTSVTFSGSTCRTGGWFLAHGDLWWPSSNDANQGGRPHWFSFSVTGLVIENIKVLNPVAWVFSIGGSNIEMFNTLIDARSTDGFPFNTDGIDLSGSNVLIDGLEVHNGDDVINVSPPSVNVTVRNVLASGTHGISVSCSSGVGGNYLFENALIYNSLMGARFKGVLGTTCNLSDVTWRNFEIRNTSYLIHFTETYVDQERPPTGTIAAIAAYTKNFNWENIWGSSAAVIGDGSCITDPCWYASLDQSPSKALYLLCDDHAHCEDFHFSNIRLKTARGAPAGEECTGLEGVRGMGITCTNGTILAD